MANNLIGLALAIFVIIIAAVCIPALATYACQGANIMPSTPLANASNQTNAILSTGVNLVAILLIVGGAAFVLLALTFLGKGGR